MRTLQCIGFFMLTNSNIFAAAPASAFSLVFQWIWLVLGLIVLFIDWKTKP